MGAPAVGVRASVKKAITGGGGKGQCRRKPAFNHGKRLRQTNAD
jgi:hypothetical protein